MKKTHSMGDAFLKAYETGTPRYKALLRCVAKNREHNNNRATLAHALMRDEGLNRARALKKAQAALEAVV